MKKYKDALERMESSYFNCDNCLSAMRQFSTDRDLIWSLIDLSEKRDEFMERKNICLNLSKLDLNFMRYAVEMVNDKVKSKEITIGDEELDSLQYVIGVINKELGTEISYDECELDDRNLIPY